MVEVLKSEGWCSGMVEVGKARSWCGEIGGDSMPGWCCGGDCTGVLGLV